MKELHVQSNNFRKVDERKSYRRTQNSITKEVFHVKNKNYLRNRPDQDVLLAQKTKHMISVQMRSRKQQTQRSKSLLLYAQDTPRTNILRSLFHITHFSKASKFNYSWLLNKSQICKFTTQYTSILLITALVSETCKQLKSAQRFSGC